MPYRSDNQRKFVHLVKNYKEGKAKNVSVEVIRAAKSLKDESIEHFINYEKKENKK